MMRIQTAFQSSVYERTVIDIMRKLPFECILQLVDFAHSLEFKVIQKGDDDCLDEKESEIEEGICDSEEKWDELFAKPEAKQIMCDMAHEALEDYRARLTTDIVVTKDGRLAPA